MRSMCLPSSVGKFETLHSATARQELTEGGTAATLNVSSLVLAFAGRRLTQGTCAASRCEASDRRRLA
jgi:hypothetical protein